MLIICTTNPVSNTISYNGVTLTFASPVSFGYFETDGSPWIVGPVAFPTISDSGVTGRHGAMINPSQITAQGYDSRVNGYDASLNVKANPPATLSPGDSLVVAVSLNPENASIGTGGSSTGIDKIAIFTCLSAPPASGAFRPPYAGTDKTMRNRSEVNHALSPALAKPTGPVTSLPTLDMTNYAKLPLYDVGVRSGMRSKLRPQTNFGGDVYPAYAFQVLGHAAAYSLLNESMSNEVRHRLVQHGIDYWAIAQFCNNSFSNGAGFGANGALFSIIYAGYFLNDTAMLAAGAMTAVSDSGVAIPKWGEQYQFYYDTRAWDGYVLPKPREKYLNGPPLYGDHPDTSTGTGLASNWSERNIPAQEAEIVAGRQTHLHHAYNFGAETDYDPAPPLMRGASPQTTNAAGAYMRLAAKGHMGMLFVCRKLGIDQYFYAPATFDWLEIAVNDCFNLHIDQGLSNIQTYVFGGNSNSNVRNFLYNMYLNYHGDRATLSGQSAVATGATTATLTVTTNKTVGKIHAVVTTSATKPNGHQVRNGMDHSGVSGKPRASSDFLTTSGEKTLNLTGLQTGVAQYIHVTHYGEDASIASVVTAGPITPA